METTRSAKLSLITAMVIFGTIGIFRRYIPLSSAMLALVRGAVGTAFLLALVHLKGSRADGAAIRKNLLPLCASGAFIGFNWILLFEAYRYTSVATATLCYYMAPILVILASPILFRERLTAKKALCVAAAFAGMVLVSGVLDAGFGGISEMRGVLLGLGAAVLYATVILMNKFIRGISAYDKTIVQLASAAIVLLPYTLVTEDWSALEFTPLILVMLLIVGVVHTGWAYALYFGSISALKTQTVALFSYIDPIVAILLSALLLREGMSILSGIGAVLVLGSTLVSELTES